MERFDMWCWKRMEGIIWTDVVINAGVFLNLKGAGILYKKIKNQS
jgi:hypothetical protein